MFLHCFRFSRTFWAWLWARFEPHRPIFLCLVGVRLHGLAGVVQCHVDVSVDLCDLVNSLFDPLGAPAGPQGSAGGVVHGLVQRLALPQGDLVLVPRTHDAAPPVELLAHEEEEEEEISVGLAGQ